MSESKKLDLTKFRGRIGDLQGKAYWRSLEDLSRSEEFEELMRDEFPRQAMALDNGVGRRDFVKLMGASVALAGLTACRRPEQLIVPYVNQPENLIPGKPLYFASAMSLGGYAKGVLVESHMGRPTKIEGNPEHPSSLGATDAFMQASILGLYDPDRSQVVRRLGEISTWSEFVAAVQPVLAAAKANPSGFRLLTQTVTSPTLGAQIQALAAQYPGMMWHQWEPANGDNVREGGRLAFGSYVNTIYHFDRANVVVTLASDFTSDGPGNLRYAREFVSRRRVRHGQTTSMNRLYAIETTPTSTGSIADHRLPVKPSQIEAFARALAGAPAPAHQEWIAAVVKDLQANRGASIVIAGDDQPAVIHAIAHAINQSLGNIGTTVTITDPVEVAPVNQLQSLRQLVTDMKAGAVKTLVVIGGNPVFDAPADFDFRSAFVRVPFRVHVSGYYDETSITSHWHIPETHYLESWGDARGHDGSVSIIQPLIEPLYNGRSPHEVLGALLGIETSPHDTVRNHWNVAPASAGGAPPRAGATPAEAGATFELTWRKWLHDGFIAGSALTPRAGGAAAMPPASTAPAARGIEIELKPDPTIYDGRFANNGWLQELPKPQTKITWENVLLISPRTAESIGYDADQREGLVNEKRTRIAEVKYRGATLELPIWVVPGQPDDVVTISYGYGRAQGGKIAKGTGANLYPIRFSDAMHGGGGVEIKLTGRPAYPIACTQEHQSIDAKYIGERGIIRSASFEEYKKNPDFAKEEHHGAEGHEESIYKPFAYKQAWAMAIDTTVCTGCNGCVIACQAENNISIVGKKEVVREREMQWLRIDRYYRGSIDNPEVFHQPVPCMQCEQAPCEPVCPVEATSHSHDGLNDMTYNRCVGTRYCSNNCPYKVRRFNFFHYADYDTPALKPMRNPDVTIRTRGVMEKCTYCVQRINHAKIEAEKEDRLVRDGEVTTACAQACPTDAIVFGDMNDPNSRVAQLKSQPTNYALLEELNTKPRTTYLATIRNPNPEIKSGERGAESGEEHHGA